MMGHIAVEPEPAEPPVRQIEVDLFAEAPLGADTEATPDDQHAAAKALQSMPASSRRMPTGKKGIEGEKGLPPEATGWAVQEYLAMLDDAAFGAATEVTPKFISPADPAARWTGANGGQAFFAYSTNYLIGVDNAIIVDVEATTAIRQAEVLAAKRMIERSMERFDLVSR